MPASWVPTVHGLSKMEETKEVLVVYKSHRRPVSLAFPTSSDVTEDTVLLDKAREVFSDVLAGERHS